MKSTGRDRIVNELKSRMKLLEKQKGGAEMHMREKLMVSLISESVNKADNPDQLLFDVLERMSVLLDIPLGACCEIVNNKTIPIEVYNYPDTLQANNCGVTMSKQVAAQLTHGPVILQKGTEKFKEIKFSKEFSPEPRFIALFPFQTLYYPFGTFIFFEFERKKDQFLSLSATIQHLIKFAVEKLEKLKLQEELKNLNSSFEEKLETRTLTLSNKIEKLSRQIKNEQEKGKKKKPIAKKIPVQDDLRLQHFFLKSIGVEIRTPLNGIMGFAELIRGNSTDHPEVNNYIDIIKSCGKSLMKIVDDAREYSMILSNQAKLKKVEFPLSAFMNDMYDRYMKDELLRQREDVELKININLNESAIINTDRDKLMLILANLIGNSIKFTGSGNIEFGCSMIENKGRRTRKKYQDVLFFVKDTGIGIGEEHADHIYQEFYKVEHEISKLYGGLGLGLTIAKALVEMMGGKIWFESAQDKGTEFYFTLPDALQVSQSEMDVLNGEADFRKYNWDNKQILIVEDDAMSVIYLKEALKSTGAKIVHAGNGTSAVDLLKAGTPVDMILMDIKLPGISGYDATQQIKAFSDVPIIAQTAYAMADDYKKILQVGCDDYVSKPINRRKLLKKINDLFTLAAPELSD